MTGSQKILLTAGLALTILGMTYGFWYALADEHPTLERMGLSLASAFAEVAADDMAQAQEYLGDYGDARFEYIRDVHTHSHLASLSTLLLLLGLFFNRVAFGERTRLFLASVLVLGALALPLGSFLEMFVAGPVPKALSVLGALCAIAGMGATAFGFVFARENQSGD